MRAHAGGPVAFERAVQPVAAAAQAAVPLADAAGERLLDPPAAVAVDAGQAQVVRILAAVGELDDRAAGLQLRAREREVELARLDEQARRRRPRGGRGGERGEQREREAERPPHRRIFGRATLAPLPSTEAGSTPNQSAQRAE